MLVLVLVRLLLFLLLVLLPLVLVSWFVGLRQNVRHRDAGCFEEGLCLIQLYHSTQTLLDMTGLMKSLAILSVVMLQAGYLRTCRLTNKPTCPPTEIAAAHKACTESGKPGPLSVA